VGLAIEWRNSRGTFDEIVKPIGDIRMEVDLQAARLVGKWFKDESFNQDVQLSTYILVVNVEVDSESFDPPEFDASKKLSAKKSKQLDEHNYRFKSLVVAHCVTQETIHRKKLKPPYDFEILAKLVDCSMEPGDIRDDHFVESTALPEFIPAPRHGLQNVNLSEKKKTPQFKRESKTDFETGAYKPSITKTPRGTTTSTMNQRRSQAVLSLLAEAATGKIFAKETIYILRELKMELSKEKLHEAIAYQSFSMDTRRIICKELCPTDEAAILINEITTTASLSDLVWTHWDTETY
jgi:hypothetical protein